jgi:hypothetical protein
MPDKTGSKSIAELEGVEWPPLTGRASPAVARCHELRKKPLSQLLVADLRVLIGQGVGLPFLMPPALDILERDPLVEAEHFKGDLLAVVLRASPQFFEETPEIRSRIEKVLASLPSALESLDHIDFDTSSEALDEAVDEFRRG